LLCTRLSGEINIQKKKRLKKIKKKQDVIIQKIYKNRNEKEKKKKRKEKERSSSFKK
jgi:hypothetical protein